MIAASPSMENVREALNARLPERAAGRVTPLGEGLDNYAFDVDGELVVRFRKDATAGPATVNREARVLAAVARVSPLAVPHVVFADPLRGCIAHRKLAGMPLLELDDAARRSAGASAAPELGWFLATIHRLKAAEIGEVPCENDSIADWLSDADAMYTDVAEYLPSRLRAGVRRFLRSEIPPEPPVRVFSHNDLSAEHILVDPASGVSGIIDWSDAAMIDPAYDFGLLLRDLGEDATNAVLAAYERHGGTIHGMYERAAFYARCSALEDLKFAIRTRRPAAQGRAMSTAVRLF